MFKKAKSTTFRINEYLNSFRRPTITHEVGFRDRLNVPCLSCEKPVKKQVGTLLKFPNKPPKCRSCAGRDSLTPEALEKKNKTMLARYGAVNPQRVIKRYFSVFNTR
jgi:hypothetical protein